MRLGQKGEELIKFYEQGPGGGPALEAYACPAGVWTIGWGHTRGVRFDQHATIEQCKDFFIEDAAAHELAVDTGVTVPLTQGQYDALVSLAFNIGNGNFLQSTLRRKLNAGDYAGAAQEFKRWNKSKGVTLKGLTRRRAAETKLFLTGSY